MRSNLKLFFILLTIASSSGAIAQSVSVGDTSLAGADCSDNATDVVTFTAVAASGSTSTPTMQLFATTDDCPSPDSDATSVTLPDDAISLVSSRSITDTDEDGNTAKLHARDLAKSSCDAAIAYTWNVCFYEFWQVTSTYGSTSYEHVLETATITYDSLPPDAPHLDGVATGDQHLHVSFTGTGDSDLDHYEVLVALKSTDSDEAIAASERTDGGSSYAAYDCYPNALVTSASSDGSSALVPGSDTNLLTNDLAYVVQVREVDASGNTGACSNPMGGTPQEIDDFWRLYKKDGGVDPGGCTSAGGCTLLPLLVPLACVARRRT